MEIKLQIYDSIQSALQLDDPSVLNEYGLTRDGYWFSGSYLAWLHLLEDVWYRTDDGFDPDCRVQPHIAEKMERRVNRALS